MGSGCGDEGGSGESRKRGSVLATEAELAGSDVVCVDVTSGDWLRA